MKKTILAVILAATAFSANAKNVITICGDHVVTAISALGTGVFTRIVADDVSYEASPVLQRKVEEGHLVTYLFAGDPRTGRVVLMRVEEGKGVMTGVYDSNDKPIWIEDCRDAR